MKPYKEQQTTQSKKLHLAFRVIDAMLRSGMKPDRFSYNTLISTCDKGKELLQA